MKNLKKVATEKGDTIFIIRRDKLHYRKIYRQVWTVYFKYNVCMQVFHKIIPGVEIVCTIY